MEWPRNAAILLAGNRRHAMRATISTFVLATAMAVMGCTTTPPATPANDGGTFSFSGVVKARDNGCFVDGVCTITVNDTVVTTMSGRRMGPAPIWGRVEGDPQVGTRVAVYCKRVNDDCTLEGSESFFIRVLP